MTTNGIASRLGENRPKISRANTKNWPRFRPNDPPPPALPALSIPVQNELPVLFHDAAASMTRFRDQISP